MAKGRKREVATGILPGSRRQSCVASKTPDFTASNISKSRRWRRREALDQELPSVISDTSCRSPGIGVPTVPASQQVCIFHLIGLQHADASRPGIHDSCRDRSQPLRSSGNYDAILFLLWFVLFLFRYHAILSSSLFRLVMNDLPLELHISSPNLALLGTEVPKDMCVSFKDRLLLSPWSRRSRTFVDFSDNDQPTSIAAFLRFRRILLTGTHPFSSFSKHQRLLQSWTGWSTGSSRRCDWRSSVHPGQQVRAPAPSSPGCCRFCVS